MKIRLHCRQLVLVLEGCLLLTAAGLLSFGFWFLADGALAQHRLIEEFERQSRAPGGGPPEAESRIQAGSDPAQASELKPEAARSRETVDEQEEFVPEGLVARLQAERIGLDVMVMPGTDSRTLRRGAGLVGGSALPGSPGHILVAGHRDTFFRPLRHIRKSDTLLLSTPDGSLRYEVKWLAIVEPENVDVLQPAGRPLLTLITCYPFDFAGSAPKRLVVRAGRIGTAPGSVAGRPADSE